MASLTVVRGYNQGAKYTLKGDKTILGRNADCHIVINVPAVSREHALIEASNGKYFLQDLGSRNKTFFNDSAEPLPPTTRVPLQERDRFKICDNVFEFSGAAEKAPLPREWRRGGPEADEEGETGTSTVEATITQSSRQILEAQPAERLAFLLDVTAELTRSFNVEEILPRVVDSLFQVFRQADRAFVIFAEEGDRLIPRVTRGRRRDDDSPRFSRTIVRRCLESGTAVLSEDASSESGFSLSQSIADYRIRSVMCAPLKGRNEKSFGVLQLDTQDRSKKFTQDDLKLLLAVAGQAAIAIENARLHQEMVARANLERDLELAHQVQLSFLPKAPPRVPGYEFWAHYEAAQEVGGDYYDFIQMPDGRLAAMLGDVAGKGVPAALMMAKVSSDARFTMLTEKDPADAVTRLNEFMQDAAKLDRFVTLEAGVLDPARHLVTLVSAGHNPPVVYRHRSNTFEDGFDKDFGGPPLGVVDLFPYDACSLALDPGDAVLLFSDGVTDARDRQDRDFQNDGILAALRPGPMTPQAMVERLIRAIRQHSLGCKQHDDITVVCFARNPE